MNRRTRFRIFMRDSFTCQYCGLKAPAVELHVDHRFPRSLGGEDADANFVTACIACNSGKSNLIIPNRFIYVGGPKDGESVLRRDKYPAEWIWQSADGGYFSLADAQVEGGNLEEWVTYGPTWHSRPDSAQVRQIEAEAKRLRDKYAENREPGFRLMRLLGAYLSNGYYPEFDPPGEMPWMDTEAVLLRVNFIAPAPSDGSMRTIIDNA